MKVCFFEKQLRTKFMQWLNCRNQQWKTKQSNLAVFVPLVHYFHTAIKNITTKNSKQKIDLTRTWLVTRTWLGPELDSCYDQTPSLLTVLHVVYTTYYDLVQARPWFRYSLWFSLQRCQSKKIEIQETDNFASRYLFSILKMELKIELCRLTHKIHVSLISKFPPKTRVRTHIFRVFLHIWEI